MRIGILTFHRSHNFGAILQAYALYTKLQQEGFDVSIIDYWPDYRKESTSSFPSYFWSLSFPHKIRALVKYILTSRSSGIRKRRIMNFICTSFKLEREPRFINGSDIPNLYDVCIYGSDQIWKKFKLRAFQGIDKTYFGEFQNKIIYKISYAASMGVLDLSNDESNSLSNLIENINSISVREITLKDYLRTFNLEVKLACDPTFLLNKSDWLNLFSSVKKPGFQYVLYYNIQSSELGKIASRQIARHFELELIEIPQPPIQNILKSSNPGEAGPIEFLNYIYNAEFVISSSFHGVAFSIIFEKQFYALGMVNNSDRVLTALSELKITDRYINKIEEICLNKSIDYTTVNNLLSNYKKESFDFLSESLIAASRITSCN